MGPVEFIHPGRSQAHFRMPYSLTNFDATLAQPNRLVSPSLDGHAHGASRAERAWIAGEFGVANGDANAVDNEAGLDASVWQHESVFKSELALSVKDETACPAHAGERALSERGQAAETAQGLL